MDEQETLLPLSASQRETLEEAAATYEFNLAMAPAALEYLSARGFSREAVAGARLGVVSDNPFPGHEGREGWLAIPYLDKDGGPLTIRFRCLEEHDHSAFFHGKYMSMFEDPSRTYNVGAIHAAARGRGGDTSIHICEGELDALILHQCGLHAIAIPGARGWQLRHKKMLAGFNEVYIWADGDKAGREFRSKVTKSIRSARAVRLPEGQDVGSLYVQVGQAGLMATLRGEA